MLPRRFGFTTRPGGASPNGWCAVKAATSTAAGASRGKPRTCHTTVAGSRLPNFLANWTNERSSCAKYLSPLEAPLLHSTAARSAALAALKPQAVSGEITPSAGHQLLR